MLTLLLVTGSACLVKDLWSFLLSGMFFLNESHVFSKERQDGCEKNTPSLFFLVAINKCSMKRENIDKLHWSMGPLAGHEDVTTLFIAI